MVEANRSHSAVTSITHLYVYSLPVSVRRKGNNFWLEEVKPPPCIILGMPAAYVLCRLLSQIKRQHRGLQGVIQRNKTKANTCSSISVQAIEKGAVSSSTTLTPGSDYHFSSTVPSQRFHTVHLAHISGYILEKPRTSNGSQELHHLRALDSSRCFALGRQEGERCA